MQGHEESIKPCKKRGFEAPHLRESIRPYGKTKFRKLSARGNLRPCGTTRFQTFSAKGSLAKESDSRRGRGQREQHLFLNPKP